MRRFILKLLPALLALVCVATACSAPRAETSGASSASGTLLPEVSSSASSVAAEPEPVAYVYEAGPAFRFSLIMPLDYEGKLVFEEVGERLDVYHKASYDEMAYEIDGVTFHGGLLFSVVALPKDDAAWKDYERNPGFGSFFATNGVKRFALILPTDVQFSPEGQDEYLEIIETLLTDTNSWPREFREGIFEPDVLSDEEKAAL